MLFLEEGKRKKKGREKERERNIEWLPLLRTLMGSEPLCPEWGWNL